VDIQESRSPPEQQRQRRNLAKVKKMAVVHWSGRIPLGGKGIDTGRGFAYNSTGKTQRLPIIDEAYATDSADTSRNADPRSHWLRPDPPGRDKRLQRNDTCLWPVVRVSSGTND
jgi:hypothetical protein